MVELAGVSNQHNCPTIWKLLALSNTWNYISSNLIGTIIW